MVKFEIDFSKRNLGVLVNIWDKNNNRYYKADALFDTGAHTSAIDKYLFLTFGLFG